MTSNAHRRSIAAAAVCWTTVGLSVAIYGWRLARGVFRNVNYFDDAYSFLRYADNLLAGHGLAWNPGESQVYGVTSLLHLFVITLARWILPLPDATLLSGVSAAASLGVVATLALVCAGFSRFLTGRTLTWLALIVPPLVLRQAFTFHALSGMDTMLGLFCNALLIGSVLAYVDRPERRGMVLVLATAYLAFLVRPDNGVYVTLFPVLAIVLLGSRETRNASLRRFVVGIFAILILDAAVKQFAFGDVAPLGYFAKQDGYYSHYAAATHLNPIKNMRGFFDAGAPFLVVLILLGRRRDWPLVVTFLVPVVLTSAFYLTVVQVMGLFSRYYYPSLPFLVVVAALVFDRWYGERRRSIERSGLIVRVVAASALLSLGPIALQRSARFYGERFIEPVDTSLADLYEVDARSPVPVLGWSSSIDAMVGIVQNVPAGTSVALSEYGRIGAAASQVILFDLVGLHDREFAHHGFSVATLLAREPDMIWGPHTNYVGILERILCEPRFWQDYEYYPRLFDYGIALRKASPRLALLRERVATQTRRSYGDLDLESQRARRSLDTDCDLSGP